MPETADGEGFSAEIRPSAAAAAAAAPKITESLLVEPRAHARLMRLAARAIQIPLARA